ncbi:hairy/enhancer-of-split related with YRPW motif protein 1-like [Gigantopelta aegis]|uniref:hairy/enhancer-of-split related with YRPW motif protein 1-like n=1 Tax=Gigantopelta aegis TaxID=1735272 RepID=UPI001B8897FB|nr:hairy/enhancer-of-split related with YRPW motif protein 1-like [Gigantopelta aegis]
MDTSPTRKDQHDQVSHKVIEKRRRDRINNCLTELSQTVPPAFAKQTTGKLEKAEILEMTVEYLRALQATEMGMRFEQGEWYSPDIWTDFSQHYRDGYSECLQEVLRFMTDVEGLDVNDGRCVRIVSFLQTRFKHRASLTGGATYQDTLQQQVTTRTDKRHEITSGRGFEVPQTVAGLPVSLMTSPAGYLQGAKPSAFRPSPIRDPGACFAAPAISSCLPRHPTASCLPRLSPFLTGIIPNPHLSRQLCRNDSLLTGSQHSSRPRIGTSGL